MIQEENNVDITYNETKKDNSFEFVELVKDQRAYN